MEGVPLDQQYVTKDKTKEYWKSIVNKPIQAGYRRFRFKSQMKQKE